MGFPPNRACAGAQPEPQRAQPSFTGLRLWFGGASPVSASQQDWGGWLVCCFAVRPCFLRFIVISALSHRSMPHQRTLLLLHLWQPLKLAAPTGRDTEHQRGSAQLPYGPWCRVGSARELRGRSVTKWVPCAEDGPPALLGPSS